jgi:hypothetical protein
MASFSQAELDWSAWTSLWTDILHVVPAWKLIHINVIIELTDQTYKAKFGLTHRTMPATPGYR